MPPTWNTIALLTPEVLLILAATAIFVAGPFRRAPRWWALAATVAYIGAAVLLAGKEYALGLSGPLVIDPLALSLRGLAIFVGLVFTGMLARLADDDLAS